MQDIKEYSFHQKHIFTNFFLLIQCFLREILGTRYGPVGTRFLGFYGPDFL